VQRDELFLLLFFCKVTENYGNSCLSDWLLGSWGAY